MTSRITEILNAGLRPIIKVVEENLTQEQGFEREKFYIKKFGRADLGLGSLLNKADGGKGPNGSVRSQAVKDLVAAKHRGMKRPPLSDETRERMRQGQLNKPPVSDETRIKLAERTAAYWARRRQNTQS